MGLARGYTFPRAGAGALSGVPEVVDTSTLRIDGKIVRLFGVEWERGAQAENEVANVADGVVQAVHRPI